MSHDISSIASRARARCPLSCYADVHFRGKGDRRWTSYDVYIRTAKAHVRFTPNSGHWLVTVACPL